MVPWWCTWDRPCWPGACVCDQLSVDSGRSGMGLMHSAIVRFINVTHHYAVNFAVGVLLSM